HEIKGGPLIIAAAHFFQEETEDAALKNVADNHLPGIWTLLQENRPGRRVTEAPIWHPNSRGVFGIFRTATAGYGRCGDAAGVVSVGTESVEAAVGRDIGDRKMIKNIDGLPMTLVFRSEKFTLRTYRETFGIAEPAGQLREGSARQRHLDESAALHRIIGGIIVGRAGCEPEMVVLEKQVEGKVMPLVVIIPSRGQAPESGFGPIRPRSREFGNAGFFHDIEIRTHDPHSQGFTQSRGHPHGRSGSAAREIGDYPYFAIAHARSPGRLLASSPGAD